jgi:hypothetical protein
MHRLNVALVAGLLALAAILGTEAATRTVSLGAIQRHASTASLGARVKQLDAFERSLQRALARRMPKLPRVPRVPPPTPASAAPLVSAAPAQAAPVRTVYQRPPPIVVVKHTHHGDDGGFEAEGGGGGGGGGGD